MVNKLITVLVLVFGIANGNLLNKNFEELNSPTNFIIKVEKSIVGNNNISLQCKLHLKGYMEGLKGGKLWAIRLLDAGAKIPAGILEGNVVELGSFDECLKVEGNITVLSKPDKLFGKYCIGTIPIETLLQFIPIPQQMNFNALEGENPKPKVLTATYREHGFHLATCLPDRCSATDIQEIYAIIFKPAKMIFAEEMCQTKAGQPTLNGGSVATLVFFGVTLLIMVLSTVYDIAVCYSESKSPYPWLIAFSVLTNGKKILQTSNHPSQINCLHGIRVLSTMWVIIGHRYSFQISFPVQNSFELIKFVKSTGSMFIFGAPVAVDTFFLMSGLVLVYVYMGAIEKGAKFNIFSFWLHRYLRLTPVVAVTVLIHVTLLRHFGSGPLWPGVQDRLITACENNWWKALLYIQNFGSDICVPHSWYLALDTQLFVLSPLLLIPLKTWPKYTISATGFLTFCSILSCFCTNWFLELGRNIEVTFDPDRQAQYMNYYYSAPWTRAAPWLIGLILGYYIFVIKQRKINFPINKLLVVVLWSAALTVLCVCVFAGHDGYIGKYHRLTLSFQAALVRPAWAIAVGWVIFACVTGNGGPVNWFLSSPLFQVVSKVTFTMYMVHFIIVFMEPAQMRSPPMFTTGRMMYGFWGDFAFTFAVAVIFTLAFESPVIAVEKLILRGGNKKKVQESVVSQNEEKPNDIV